MNTLMVIFLSVLGACTLSVLIHALIGISESDKRHECYDLARQMLRDWSTYSDEKKLACAQWLGMLGVKLPKEML